MTGGEILTVVGAVIVALIAATPPTLMGLKAMLETRQTRRNVGDGNGFGSLTAQVEHVQGRLDAHVAEQDAARRAMERRLDTQHAASIERHDAIVARLDAHEAREFARTDRLLGDVHREVRAAVREAFKETT